MHSRVWTNRLDDEVIKDLMMLNAQAMTTWPQTKLVKPKINGLLGPMLVKCPTAKKMNVKHDVSRVDPSAKSRQPINGVAPMEASAEAPLFGFFKS
uniref:Uncharacterized protein n=1 Tax=Romanomermis culicivorax TaxID=13658 RepID=A0A915JU71_ROMCU